VFIYLLCCALPPGACGRAGSTDTPRVSSQLFCVPRQQYF